MSAAAGTNYDSEIFFLLFLLPNVIVIGNKFLLVVSYNMSFDVDGIDQRGSRSGVFASNLSTMNYFLLRSDSEKCSTLFAVSGNIRLRNQR